LSRFSGYAALALMLVPVPLFFAYFILFYLILFICNSIYFIAISAVLLFLPNRGLDTGCGSHLVVAIRYGSPAAPILFPCVWRSIAILVGSQPFCYHGYLLPSRVQKLSTPLVPKAMFMLPVGPDWFGAALLSCLVAALPSMILESWPMCLRT